MKKNLIVALALAGSFSAFAQFSTSPDSAALRVSPQGKNIYLTEHGFIPAEGKTWVFYASPTRISYTGIDTLIGSIQPFLQLLDEKGYPMFDTAIRLASNPTLSFTTKGNKLFVDKAGNALLCVVDSRKKDFNQDANQENTFLYKVSPSGQFLWGPEGINLDSLDYVYNPSAQQSMIQLANGDYVFYVQNTSSLGSTTTEYTCKLKESDGSVLWRKKLGGAGLSLLAADGNNFFAISGTKVTKYNSLGDQMWSKSLSAPGEKASGEPLAACHDGKGGIVMAFNVGSGDLTHMYVGRISPDGQAMFDDGKGHEGIPVNGPEPNRFKDQAYSIAYDSISDKIYALWQGTVPISFACSYMGVQCFDGQTGEPQWSDSARLIEPIGCGTTSFSYMRSFTMVVPGQKVMFAYQVSEFMNINGVPVQKYFMRYRMYDMDGLSLLPGDGEDNYVDVCRSPNFSMTAPFITSLNKNRWTMSWRDNGARVAVINVDGTLGYNPNVFPVAIKDVYEKSKNTVAFTIHPNPATDKITVLTENGVEVKTIDITDLNGRSVMPKMANQSDNTVYIGSLKSGAYMVKIVTNKGIATQKLVKK